jgi:hypothetical protein
VTSRPFDFDRTRDARLCRDARGRNGRIREELAAGVKRSVAAQKADKGTSNVRWQTSAQPTQAAENDLSNRVEYDAINKKGIENEGSTI